MSALRLNINLDFQCESALAFAKHEAPPFGSKHL